jgi:putative ABC transport system substrate-binding protein
MLLSRHTRRREFITLIGGATVWPLAARAQQLKQTRHVGVFLRLAQNADDPSVGEILRPFKSALQEAGWQDGTNLRLDYRYGGGELAKIDSGANELVALAPELIYAMGLPPTLAVRRRTRTIPIVFSLVADPVGFGLVDSVNRPGGNVTGFVVGDLSIGGKWLQLLQEIAPDLAHVGIMYNPDTAPYAPALMASARAAAKGVSVSDCLVRNERYQSHSPMRTETRSSLNVTNSRFQH